MTRKNAKTLESSSRWLDIRSVTMKSISWLLCIAEFALFLVSVFGNLLVLIVMLGEKQQRTASKNCYVIAIAFIDFLSAVFAIPFNLYWLLSSELDNSFDLCIWMTSANIVLCLILINLLVSLSADRYWAVCHPMFYFQYKNSAYRRWVILMCVALGSIGAVPLVWNNKSSNTCYVIDVLSFGFLFLCCFWTLTSSAIIITFYGLIYKSLANHVRS